MFPGLTVPEAAALVGHIVDRVADSFGAEGDEFRECVRSVAESSDWLRGSRAYSIGTPYADCPFPKGERRIQWQEGWMQCKADEGSNDD